MDYLPAPIVYLQHALDLERGQAYRLLALIAFSALVAGGWLVSTSL